MRLLVNDTTHLYVLQKLICRGHTERILQFIMELKLIYQKNCFNEQKCLKKFPYLTLQQYLYRLYL
jgi:hypothetical protein